LADTEINALVELAAVPADADVFAIDQIAGGPTTLKVTFARFRTGTFTLLNKTFDLTDNTLVGSVAEFNTALQADTFAFISDNLSVFAATTKAQLESVLSDVADIAEADGDTYSGAHLFNAATMRIPLSATPTIAVDGDFAIDTLVTDFSHGILKYFDGEELGVISMPIAQFTSPTGGFVVAYNAANDEFELVAGGGVGTWTDTSTNTGTNKTLNDFTNSIEADAVHAQVRNESGSTMNQGDAVVITGFKVADDLPIVGFADASSVATMPSFCIINETIANNTNGDSIVNGRVSGFDTSAFAVGDSLFVSNVGTSGNTLTATKPTGTDIIQKIAVEIKDNASNGIIYVIGPGRENDTPNVLTQNLDVNDFLLQFSEADQDILGNAGGMEYDTPSGDTHEFFIAAASEMVLSATALTLGAGNNIILQASGALGLITMGELTTPATPAANTGSFYVKDVGTVSTAFFIGDDGVEKNITTGVGDDLGNHTATEIIKSVTFGLQGQETGQTIIGTTALTGWDITVPAGDAIDCIVTGTGTIAQIDSTGLDVQNGTLQEGGIDTSPIGPQDIYLDAGAFKSKTTSGVASGQLDTRELGTNDNDIDYFEFTNAGGIQRIMGQLVLPRNFNNTNISVQIYWTTPNATTGDVAWKVQLLPRSDNDALDFALLAEVEIPDTFLLANDLHVTTLTALTLSGAADGDFYFVQIGRNPADTEDTLDGEAQFLGALFQVTTDGATAV